MSYLITSLPLTRLAIRLGLNATICEQVLPLLLLLLLLLLQILLLLLLLLLLWGDHNGLPCYGYVSPRPPAVAD